MGNNLLPRLEEFIALITSLIEDMTLPKHERLEHLKLRETLEGFALAIKTEIDLKESPVNLTQSLFVQIYRMSLSRGRRAVFLEKADRIEREANLIPHTASLYLNRDELIMVTKATVYYESLMRHGIDSDAPIKRACQKLKNTLAKCQISIEDE